ncbi:bifunctional cytidylyltransferase/SDR family oxidoreductase [Nonomuraea indica]|uniref:bifunctional cytidylyltransferase/SDR family oxidoreductase n=1 Tax=Nonomuraea indica TaxID=1581193 RepID=UPI001FE32876|nr:bifunctional cytidylyltransferase/SDR family oxidoreductase [Nonomuraea indica]
MRSVGVVLAGGVGSRVGLGVPKQLVTVAGRTILEHTIAVFEAAPEIDEIVVLMTPGFTGRVGELVERAGFHKVTRVVEGGASRTESTWRALRALGDEECDVLLHDAVRPLLEPRIITECVRALRTHRAVEVAIPSSDTVLVAAPGAGGEVIGEVLDRSRLRRAQTPQCFRLSVIREAYERAMADPGFSRLPATDDCGVVLRYLPDVPIHLVAGSERNMKVTHPVDLEIAERLFQLPAAPVAAAPGSLEGRTVAVFTGSGPAGGDVAEAAAGHGARVRVFAGDEVRVDDPEAVAGALARAGRIDHVVDATGLDPGRGAACLGAAAVARAARPHLRRSGGGLLLLGPGPAEPVAAVVTALARALAAEWADDGIRVNCVTAGTGPVDAGQVDAGQVDAGQVARAALGVLASDRTGQVVDAGLAAR